MSSITKKPCCVTCGKEITVLKCEGCWQIDYSRQSEVRHEATCKPFDEPKMNQEISDNQEAKKKQQHVLIQRVDDWECNAMNQIRQTAEEARQLILKHTTDRILQIETKLTKLTEQLRQCHRENNFIPQNVSQWHDELAQLTKQLVIPSRIIVEEVSSPLVTNIVVRIPEELEVINEALVHVPNIVDNAKWIQNGITVAGGNGHGNGLNQFNKQLGLYVDDDQTIYVTDQLNHRVVEWKSGATSGQVIAGGNGQGSKANQLSQPGAVIVDKESDSLIISDYGNKRVVRWPRRNGTTGEIIISDVGSYGLVIDSSGYLYVSDKEKHEVKRWKIGETNGTVVAGGNGRGNGVDQLSNPMDIFVDQDHSVYVSDWSNHRVVKWLNGAKEGIVVAGGQGQGSGVTQLFNPWGVTVEQLGTIYVADRGNHRIMRWTKGATEGSVVVGGNGAGAQSNQLNICVELSFDKERSLFVSDHENHRIQKFTIDPNSI